MAQRLGLSTDAYQELRYAAKKADVDQETFNSSMGSSRRGSPRPPPGQGEALVGVQRPGISVRDSTGHLRKMEDLLPDVADKLGMVQNQSLRNAIAAKLFGKEGAKLNGIFNDGASGLAEGRQEAHKVGAVMSTDQIKEAEKFDDAMKEIGATVMMVRNMIGAALAPKLVELGQKLQTYILANKDKIASGRDLRGQAPRCAREDRQPARGRGLRAAGDRLRAPGSWTPSAARPAVGALLVYFAPLISAFFSFIGALAGLVPRSRPSGRSSPRSSESSRFWAALFVGLVGLPVAIGAALVAAAILIWKYWEPIKEFFSSIGDKISGLFGGNNKFTGTLSTQAPPQLGAELGFGKTVDAAARSSSTKNENHVLVDFQNLPTGTRVETQKADGTSI
jgi:hypothetical protein